MCNKMSINTADFAALAVTIVLFAVIYYLDYKKGVDFGLLTLLGTVFGIAVGLGFGNHFTYVRKFQLSDIHQLLCKQIYHRLLR